jgi:hypothetical protein
MTNAIRDIETLKSIQPNEVIAYLKRTGWQKETSIPDKAEIWVLKKENSDQDWVDILLPLNTSFQDYPIRMSEILVTLEEIEDRSQKEIFKSLTHQPVTGISRSKKEIMKGLTHQPIAAIARPKKRKRRNPVRVVSIKGNFGFYAKNLD